MENIATTTESLPDQMLQALRSLDQQANAIRQQGELLMMGFSLAKGWGEHRVNFDIQAGTVTAEAPGGGEQTATDSESQSTEQAP